MKLSSKGFTLVELLAVIVILAIILVIAIPNVINIISKTKADVYAKNEQMLKEAARNYLIQNGITVVDGQSVTISYAQLKSSQIIDSLKDVKDNSECTPSTTSVKVSNSGGTYTYVPTLVCSNYVTPIDISSEDLLASQGKFENDVNSDGIADTWGIMFPGNTPTMDSTIKRSGSKSQKIVRNAGTNPPTAFQRSFSFITNHKYYVRAYCYYSSSSTGADPVKLSVGTTDVYSGALSTPFDVTLKDQWQMKSLYLVSGYPGSTFYVGYLIDPLMANTTVFYADDIIVLDLTAKYGAGNEPTQVQMDALIFQ